MKESHRTKRLYLEEWIEILQTRTEKLGKLAKGGFINY